MGIRFSKTVFMNCSFLNNETESGGAVVTQDDFGSVFNNCLFSKNKGTMGAAIHSEYIQCNQCIFINNEASNSGGVFNGDTGLFYRCIFRNNHANFGGAMRITRHSVVSNCLFEGNVADTSGGAFILHSAFNPDDGWTTKHYVLQSTFVGNQAPSGSVFTLSGWMIMSNNIIADGTPEDLYIPERSTVVESGTLYNNPHFTDAAHGDYRLMPDSPAIDANMLDTQVPELHTPDLAGTERPIGANWDLGAYEYDPQADSDGDGLTNDIEWNTHHTHPYKADTDGDHVSDGLEIQYGTDPLDPSSTPPILPLAAGAALTGLLLFALWRARRMSR